MEEKNIYCFDIEQVGTFWLDKDKKFLSLIPEGDSLASCEVLLDYLNSGNTIDRIMFAFDNPVDVYNGTEKHKKLLDLLAYAECQEFIDLVIDEMVFGDIKEL